MTEREFQALVIDLATMRGWSHYHTHNSRRSNPGWPDLALWHPRQGRFLLRELKTDKGRLAPAQTVVLSELTRAGVDATVWRPSDLPLINLTLASGGNARKGGASD